MTYSGGSTLARKCINHLKQSKALVDVYSLDWLEKNPTYSYFSADDFKEFQAKSDGACAGHLLIISAVHDLEEVSNLLISAHKPFSEAFGPDQWFKPNFVFVNLATKQILCTGLGRKNYFYAHSIGENKVQFGDSYFNFTPNNGIATEVSAQKKASQLFMESFCKYDFAGVVDNMLESLYEFGCNASGWDHLPLNPDLIEEIIEAGPDSDGMYNIDDELMSLDEVNEIVNEFERFDRMGNEDLHILQLYFPDLTWADLNTQAY